MQVPLAPAAQGKEPGNGKTVVPDPGRVIPEETGFPGEPPTIAPGPVINVISV